ncbi:hypothetical protein [Microbacterium sp. NPDC096154]|uniref:hypothetical protein n=1 Tax=Microbacterium sp. NPDC096154 TaxID=3155549 RepID=UPI003322C8F5
MGGTIIAVGQAPGAPSAVRPVADALPEIIDAVQSVEGDVLLLTREPEARRLSRAARLTLGAERVALHHADAPLTAWVLALHLVEPLAAAWPVGQLGAAVDAALHAVRTRVVLSSLTTLEAPAPTLAQHLTSMLPGTAYEVDLTAGTIQTARTAMALHGPTAVIARSDRPVHKAYRDWQPPGLVLPGARAGWRAARWCEASEAPIPAAALNDVFASLPGGRCPVCDRVGSSRSCLFCDVPLDGAAPDGSGVTV